MEADRPTRFDDLWTPNAALPQRRLLKAIARRCGQLWHIPGLAEHVRVCYNSRLRTTLGRALLEDHTVELNTRLLRTHPTELLATLVHELAHLAVHIRYGRVRPHGRQFHALMAAAGFSAKATHSLPAGGLKRRRRRYLYLHRCGDCGMTFIARSVRRDCYCISCGPGMSWTVLRAPNTQAGRKALAQHRDAVEAGA